MRSTARCVGCGPRTYVPERSLHGPMGDAVAPESDAESCLLHTAGWRIGAGRTEGGRGTKEGGAGGGRRKRTGHKASVIPFVVT